MKHNQINCQYATGVSRHGIEQALVEAGLNPESLAPADLALLEDFHTMGRLATIPLVDLAGVTSADMVLDAGSGIGGTARLVAERCGCKVSAVDLTEEYCETSRWLNGLVGLDDLIAVRQADVTALPFADSTFQVVFSQHVQMNVADKARLYSEARRVLAVEGRLAMWDIVSGGRGEPDYPQPWADDPGLSYLTTSDRLRTVVASAGFAIDHWNDLTDEASATMQALLALPRGPLGLHAFVPEFTEKVENLVRGLADGRLRAVRVIARAIPS